MNSMVLISEEVRSDLLGRRASGAGDRDVRASSGFREGYAANNGLGETRASSGAEASSRDEAERHLTETEGSDASDDWRTWMRRFEIGDMVWGKVKSHPWWPGHIFNEAFASVSVRRTKREGHVLVAFFGDSSYGWFEPSELVPFEWHYAEKSRQMTSRNFLKAVDEAVDEVSRRRALGLSCRCSAPSNFRPTSVPGFVAVDVIGFEPNLVYSVKEVEKARDDFVPTEVVSGLRRLALTPGELDRGSIATVKSMATLLALRKATYEEFDETYAQAFGVEPQRPPREGKGTAEQPRSGATRAAPLSGPLVVAETLGKKKAGVGRPASKAPLSSSSSTVKERVKKSKYLFKRRDDALSTKQPSISANVRCIDFAQRHLHSGDASLPPSDVDSYLLQKRPPPETPKSEPEPPREVEPEPPREVEPEPPREVEPKPKDEIKTDLAAPVVETKSIENDGVKIDADAEVVPPPEQFGCVDPKKDSEMYARKKLPPRAGGDVAEKKKKRKKRLDSEGAPGVDRPKQAKLSADQETKKRSTTSVSPHVEKPGGGTTFSAISLPKIDLTAQDLDFPLLVTDLTGLALDPYYAMDRNASLLVRHVFLRFRSLVYQKSLVPRDTEPYPEPRTVKGESAAGSQQEPSSVPKKPKPVQKVVSGREDDARAGRKRPPSDRQEEMMAKREKKVKHLKTLASEKKASIGGNRTDTTKSEGQKEGVAKVAAATAAAAGLKGEKKGEFAAAPKVPSPTYLFMKFPPGTTLPSVSSQKVKFGRFGQLDVSGIRVYWKSHTCKILFKFRSDAQNAYMYATNNDMFGQIKVSYSLRDAEVHAPPKPAETDRPPVDTRADSMGMDPRLTVLRNLQQQQQHQQQGAQLKSCLKKPPGDEAAASGVKEGPRVKFALSVDDGRRESPTAGTGDGQREAQSSVLVGNGGGNGGGRGEPPPAPPAAKGPPILSMPTGYGVQRPINPPPSSSSPPPYPPSVLTRRLQTPPQFPPPPPPPPPPQHVGGSQDRPLLPFPRSQPYQGQGMERTESDNVDISNQMLNLLVRCNDLVTKVNSALGYAIYHPL